MNEEAAGFNFGTSTNGFGMSDLLPNLSNANQQLEGQGLNSVFPPFQGTPQRAVTQYMGNSSPYDFHMGHDHTPTTSQKRARVDSDGGGGSRPLALRPTGIILADANSGQMSDLGIMLGRMAEKSDKMAMALDDQSTEYRLLKEALEGRIDALEKEVRSMTVVEGEGELKKRKTRNKPITVWSVNFLFEQTIILTSHHK